MQGTHGINGKAMLLASLELSASCWRVAATDGMHTPSEWRSKLEEPARRLQEVLERLDVLRQKWQLGAECELVVLYEAGQDGFWIARALQQRGVQALIVDPASVPVPRHAKRVKTDRIDARLLLKVLLDWLRGERGQVRMVHMPPMQAEDQRQLARERGVLIKEIGAHRDRMRKLLRTVGCWTPLEEDPEAQLGQLRCWDGTPLPQWLHARLGHECQRLRLVRQQLQALEDSWTQRLEEPQRRRVELLRRLKAVGEVGSMRLVLELFWRNFNNRRQVGACVGLVPAPYDSGGSHVDQGISKQSNARVRALAIEMAWMWLRWQPQSELAEWFRQRTGTQAHNKRGKRIAIVAVARRLVIALWRYLEHGVIPAGARLKAV
ncbi:MAG TPA: IS110 family transposase [Ramlibacter sp.]|nr:IS110 family transposase [Ramlibacter sp.]